MTDKPAPTTGLSATPRNRLQSAADVLAEHDTAWRFFRTRAHLAGWVAARQRGIDVPTCDAIIDAALDGVRELIRAWAAEDTADEPEQR